MSLFLYFVICFVRSVFIYFARPLVLYLFVIYCVISVFVYVSLLLCMYIFLYGVRSLVRSLFR